MAEFSHIKDLISTAQAVEDAVWYDLGTWHIEGHGSGHVPLQWHTPVGVQPNIFLRPLQAQQAQPREMVNRGPPYQMQTKLSAPKASEQHSAANFPHPAGAQHNPNTSPHQAGPICFRCGKAGHLGRDCKQGKPCAAAACLAEDKEGIPEGDHLEEEDQEETAPVIGVEQDDAQLDGDQYLNMLVEDKGIQGRPYQWDDELAELAQPEAPSIKMGAICISQWKCRGGEGDITHHKNFNPADHASHGHIPTGHAKHASPTRCAMHTSPNEPCWLASAKSSGDLPLHNHCVHKCMGM